MSLAATSIIAHRGASVDAPENTLAAFRLALEQKADGIEGDFRLSADGRIVCIHDENTQRVSGDRHVVSETTAESLRALDVGSWKGEKWRGERLPFLEEVLAIVPDGKQAFLELKTGMEIVDPLAEVLETASRAVGQIVIMSFNANLIRECKNRLPRFKCLWLTGYKQMDRSGWTPSVDEVISTLRQSGADGIGIENRPEYVTDKFVERLRAAGIGEIHVWTVDTLHEALHYQLLGASSIITNRPAALRRELSGGNR
jgi:glycerophosphoryl diester phosphodiesterase